MSTSAMDTEDLTRFAAGGRAVRSARLRRALIARLLSEQEEGAEEEGEEGMTGEGGDEDRQIVRLLLGSRMLRRRRLRRLLLAHLIRERGGDTEEEFDESDEDIGEDGGEDDRRIARLLIGSRLLRRRRVRRAVLAHLLRERGEMEDEFDEGDEDLGEEEGDRDRKFMRMLIGSRVLRRKRVRRALLARLLRDQGEGEEEDEFDEGDEDIGEESSNTDRQLARLLVAGRMAKRRRGRRALAASRLRDENY